MKFFNKPISLRLLISFLFLGIYLETQACQCLDSSPFDPLIKQTYSYSVAGYLHPKDDYDIILGVKLKTEYHGAKIKVIDSWFDNDVKDTISIWGYSEYTLHTCRGGVSHLGDQDTVLFFILKNDTSPYDPLEKEGDYTISACGEHYLRYSNGEITGIIYSESPPNINVENYEEYKARLRSEVDLILSDEHKESISTTHLYPNPASSFLHIQQLGIHKEIQQEIVLYDPLGRRYMVDVIGMKEDELRVDVSGLSQGMYFVRVGEQKYLFLRE